MPGVGPRSAEHIALWMIQSRNDQPEQIATAISKTRGQIRPCKRCGLFATEELCETCRDDSRPSDLLCVVEQPTDIQPLEKTSAFRGRYQALGGKMQLIVPAGQGHNMWPGFFQCQELVDFVIANATSQ